jgi:hypothetical protein
MTFKEVCPWVLCAVVVVLERKAGEETPLMWVVDCHKFEILYGQTSFHEPDSLEYRAIVKRHECEPSLHVPRDLFPTALGEKSFKEAMNAAKAELRIYPLSKVDRHPGSLAFRPKNITDPIFAKATGTTCLINYMSPGEYFPKGGVSFEVFLPELYRARLFGHNVVVKRRV